MPGGSETILLVEDEETVRVLASRVLRGHGYTVIEAVNGLEALHIAREQPEQEIDLLLTDVVMPKMGGRILVEQLSSSYPNLKVLFISGYTERASIQSGSFELQAPLLQKPFSPATLANKVREILDS